MFDTVVAYMDQHPDAWSSIKVIGDTLTTVKADIAEIDSTVRRRQEMTVGVGADKAQSREDLQEQIMQIAAPLETLASVTADRILAARADVSRTGLGRLSDDGLDERARSVALAGREHLGALADYGVSEASLAELDSLIEKFAEVKHAPRTAIARRAGATATLPELLSETRSLLRDRLDKMVGTLVNTQPEFVAGYRSARVVVKRSGKRRTEAPVEAIIPVALAAPVASTPASTSLAPALA